MCIAIDKWIELFHAFDLFQSYVYLLIINNEAEKKNISRNCVCPIGYMYRHINVDKNFLHDVQRSEWVICDTVFFSATNFLMIQLRKQLDFLSLFINNIFAEMQQYDAIGKISTEKKEDKKKNTNSSECEAIQSEHQLTTWQIWMFMSSFRH